MNTDRVLELAEHLDKIGTKRPFLFSHVVSCGSVGCALWDLHKLKPDIFPRSLYGFSSKYGGWVWCGDVNYELRRAAMTYFELTYEEFERMFIPAEKGSANRLPITATRAEVADNIRRIALEAGKGEK